MAANANDLLNKVGFGTATNLAAPGYTSGVSTSINVTSTTAWPSDTGVVFAIDEVETNSDGVEVRIDGTYNVFEGTVASATQIDNVDYIGGDAERSYSAGATTRVYILPASYLWNRLVSGVMAEHSQLDGTHSSAIITSRTADTTPASGDLLLTSDVSDSNNLKKATVAQILGNNATSIGGAWTTWTPTLANITLGSGSVTARYIQIGKTVWFEFMFVMGAGSAMGTAPTFTLPVTSVASLATNAQIGDVVMTDVTGDSNPGAVLHNSTTVAGLFGYDANSTFPRKTNITSTTPFTWATSDYLVARGFYQAA